MLWFAPASQSPAQQKLGLGGLFLMSIFPISPFQRKMKFVGFSAFWRKFLLQSVSEETNTFVLTGRTLMAADRPSLAQALVPTARIRAWAPPSPAKAAPKISLFLFYFSPRNYQCHRAASLVTEVTDCEWFFFSLAVLGFFLVL